MARPERGGRRLPPQLRWLLAASVAAQAGIAAAEPPENAPETDTDSWPARVSRAVELPAHRLLAEQRSAPGATLAPFTTDGCSGGMSALWTGLAERFPAFAEALRDHPPWEDCCVTHDRAYHLGGADPAPAASFDARLAADLALRACVEASADAGADDYETLLGMTPTQLGLAYDATAAAMFRAVRLGGGPCSGLPWRWGYGWPQCWRQMQ